jgi:2-dehydro-3-deoxygluconokinase
MKVVTFGEIMARLAPPNVLRFRQALPGSLHVTFAGAEANVAVSLSMLTAGDKMETEFVTALPKNVLADACLSTLRALGVVTDHVVRSESGRLGLYFLETGANQRPSQVIYDRAGSTISMTTTEDYDWAAILQDASWFHVTGITPAISQAAAECTLAAVRLAHEGHVRVSCDLNFRSKLWRWHNSRAVRELAEQTMREILPYVDVLIANEADCGDVLGIRAAETDVDAGQLDVERYPDVARQVATQFPNISQIAITLRESLSASHNNWGGMLYLSETDTAHFAPVDEVDRYQPYEIRNIVDRVGAGDAFAAGLIYALLAPDLCEAQTAIRFAAAASCLAHSLVGDFNYSSRSEVESLMRGSGSGRVVR